MLNHLPHIKNVDAGVNKWDPVHSSIFEVYMTFPQYLVDNGFVTPEDSVILSQQVTKVDGLADLQRMPKAGSQKFYGVEVSYLEPVLSETAVNFTLTLNMNLRNVTDNYVLKAFKAWGRISYDLATGSRTLKSQYCADTFRIAVANRNGEVWRAVQFHDVMITKIDGLGELDYSQGGAVELKVSFRADYWDDELA